MKLHDEVNFGDCSSSNIMMDASGMYPKGFHPSSNSLDDEAVYDAKYLSRTKTKSVKYFYIDFEMSRLIRSKSDRRVCGCNKVQANLHPRLKIAKPMTLFRRTSYYLGSVYGTHLLEVRHSISLMMVVLTSNVKKYSNMEFSSPFDRVHGPRRPKAATVSGSSSCANSQV